MTRLAKMNIEFTFEERNIFAEAFRNVMNAKREAYRQISFEHGSENITKHKESLLEKFLKKIEKEIVSECNFMLNLIENHLLPSSTNNESKVFFIKMKADCYRYLAVYSSNKENQDIASKESLKAYDTALQIATHLPSIHPYRLALALNLAIYYHEVANSPKRACDVAKVAYETAIADLETNKISDELYRDSLAILELLREKLTIWPLESTSLGIPGDTAPGDDQELHDQDTSDTETHNLIDVE